MNTITRPIHIFILALIAMVLAPSAQAQPFDSGSNGSFGPIHVVSGIQTIVVPADGIIHATTVTVDYQATLNFDKNAANTPVYLLATGDIYIEGNINVNGSNAPGGIQSKGGAAGPGGFDGGHRGVSGFPPGDGFGPGAGGGGTYANSNYGDASFGSVYNRGLPKSGSTYGTALMMPLVGGSGGGGTDHSSGLGGGGGGGGAILISSNTEITLNQLHSSWGYVYALGARPSYGGYGSGGAIRLVAPKITGNGDLVTLNGRTRTDVIDRSDYAIIADGEHSTGSVMQVFPTNMPSLSILEVAGTNVPEGSTAPVDIQLPDGTPSSQDVIVQARDFTGIVDISVVVTPNSGPSTRYDDSINMGGGNPSSTTVAVDIPVNVPVRVTAYTRNP